MSRDALFDDLAKAAAAGDARLSRRMALKLATAALVALSPLVPSGGRVLAAPPARRSQYPNTECLDCKQRVEQAYRRNRRRCLDRPFPQILFIQWCAYETELRRYTDAAARGCFGKCQPLKAPPEPVPMSPVQPQPTPPVSDARINCESVGGKCCPPNGPLCACANPSYPCTYYGCPG